MDIFVVLWTPDKEETPCTILTTLRKMTPKRVMLHRNPTFAQLRDEALHKSVVAMIATSKSADDAITLLDTYCGYKPHKPLGDRCKASVLQALDWEGAPKRPS